MTPSLEGRPTKVKETPSPHEVRLAPLHTNAVFQCLRGFLNFPSCLRKSWGFFYFLLFFFERLFYFITFLNFRFFCTVCFEVFIFFTLFLFVFFIMLFQLRTYGILLWQPPSKLSSAVIWQVITTLGH